MTHLKLWSELVRDQQGARLKEISSDDGRALLEIGPAQDREEGPPISEVSG